MTATLLCNASGVCSNIIRNVELCMVLWMWIYQKRRWSFNWWIVCRGEKMKEIICVSDMMVFFCTQCHVFQPLLDKIRFNRIYMGCCCCLFFYFLFLSFRFCRCLCLLNIHIHVNSTCESDECDFEFSTFTIEFAGKNERESGTNGTHFNIYPLVYLLCMCTE